MYCSACGKEIEDESTFCKYCGTSNDKKIERHNVSKTSGMAIASLVLDILGVPLLPIIFGIVALKSIQRQPNQITGRGMAIAGLILGAIGFVFWIIWIGFAIYAGRGYFMPPR